MAQPAHLSLTSRSGVASERPQRNDPRPVVLLVDDDDAFLHLNTEYWREHYRSKAILHTVNPMEGVDPVAWVRERLANQERLDAVYIDERIPGKSGLTILEEIREIPQALYLPVVIMTAYRDDSRDTDALEKGALRYMHKHRDRDILSPFLAEALFILPQLQDQAMDAMWIDLLYNMTTQSMEHSLPEVVDMTAEFLEKHFGNSNAMCNF